MESPRAHSWDITPTEAIALQRQLADSVIRTDDPRPLRYVAGVDASYSRFSPRVFAGVVVLDVNAWDEVESAGVETITKFPYVPGLLSFRECPAILEAFAKLKQTPDLIVVDGNGIAHPRRLGIASHLGVMLDLPTIGNAKSRLIGEHEELPEKRGSAVALLHKDEEIGRVLRTRDRVKPLYVSIGHRISLARACELILSFCTRWRQPEPIRRAHHYVNDLRRAAL